MPIHENRHPRRRPVIKSLLRKIKNKGKSMKALSLMLFASLVEAIFYFFRLCCRFVPRNGL